MMKRFRSSHVFLLTSCICFLLGTFDSAAQKTKITGTVKDIDSGEPLPYVTIAFKGTKIGTTSDMDGKFYIETYYASDSLVASYVGYHAQSLKVKRDEAQVLHFELEAASYSLQEVTIKPTEEENPAHPIFRGIIANKAANNREKLDAYEYEVYNKVEFDLNNISEEFQDKKIFKPFKFIFDNVDTTGGKTYLPMLMTESLSNFYYRRKPKAEKEVIQATKVSGVDNKSLSQFMGDMYQNVNVYDNFVHIFNKNFVSPIADQGMFFYKYYLVDSTTIGNSWCYNIKFIPKRKQEMVFTGDFWVNDTTYAIKKVTVSIAEDANINFINSLAVTQEFDQVEPEVWMLTKDKLLIDFNMADKTMGIYARKTATYKDFVINKPRGDDFYSGTYNVEVKDNASEMNDAYWDSVRHDSLTQTELQIFTMIDTMKKIPQFKTYVDIITIIVSGYHVVGNFEIGPYFSLYSYNPIEGHRFRLGGRTSNDFSTRLMLHGYTAYGTLDKRFKYKTGFNYFVSKKPRQIVGAFIKDDVEQLGQSSNAFAEDNVLNSFFRRNPSLKLSSIEEVNMFYEREWSEGFSNKLLYRRRVIHPLGTVLFPYYLKDGSVTNLNSINASEATVYTRFAYKEKFLSGEFLRVSLGTKFPILEGQYTIGFSNFLGSDYDYHKTIFGLKHKVTLGTLGFFTYQAEVGKIWGQVPYPLMELHDGNETYYYNDLAFNTMNFFEFVSDEWVSLIYTHHLNGLLLNKFPLLRKLKWREVVTGKAVMGRVVNFAANDLLLDANMNTLDTPFAEAAFGIENILKVLRVDALWRLTHLDHPNIVKFGFRAKLYINF